MDGNRRWARKRGLLPWYGHREGVEAVRTVVKFCLKEHISYLTLYTFSLENFKRPEIEKKYLFSYLAKETEKELPHFIEQNVKVRFVGDRTQFPESLKSVCERMEKETSHCSQLMLNLLFCYGGQQELVAGIKNIVRDIKSGIISPDVLSESQINQYLWLGDIPAPDLIIRTGGVQRLSNFLLYQAAYSELCFLDCLWPELTCEHLEKAIHSFTQSKRNFGV